MQDSLAINLNPFVTPMDIDDAPDNMRIHAFVRQRPILVFFVELLFKRYMTESSV